MNKDSRYGLIALSALLVTSAVFGGYVYLAQNRPVEASGNLGGDYATNNSIPLKVGWNNFTNGAWSVTKESRIVGINGSLMSISQTMQKGVVSQVAIGDGKQLLGKDISKIAPYAKFEIYATDITNSPAVFIQTKP